ncbi:MFS transporter [Streptomyces sp. NPDC001889]
MTFSSTRRAASPAPRLGRDRVFLAYCTGQAVSWGGTAVHAVALPVVAVVHLAATPGQVAVLAALSTAPAALFSLPAGVLADHRPKRTIMIATDLASAVAVTAVPVCWTLGALTVPVLYSVALVLGTLTVAHQAAALAAVAELVGPDRVPEANSRLVAATFVADTAGTVAATVLIALAGAVRALVADAVSYMAGAWCAARLPRTPPAANPAAWPRPGMVPAIRGGISFVMAHPLLRPQVQALFAYGIAEGFMITVSAYWLLTHVGVGSTGLGLIMGAAGARGARRCAGRAPGRRPPRARPVADRRAPRRPIGRAAAPVRRAGTGMDRRPRCGGGGADDRHHGGRDDSADPAPVPDPVGVPVPGAAGVHVGHLRHPAPRRPLNRGPRYGRRCAYDADRGGRTPCDPRRDPPDLSATASHGNAGSPGVRWAGVAGWLTGTARCVERGWRRDELLYGIEHQKACDGRSSWPIRNRPGLDRHLEPELPQDKVHGRAGAASSHSASTSLKDEMSAHAAPLVLRSAGALALDRRTRSLIAGEPQSAEYRP